MNLNGASRALEKVVNPITRIADGLGRVVLAMMVILTLTILIILSRIPTVLTWMQTIPTRTMTASATALIFVRSIQAMMRIATGFVEILIIA